MLCRQTIPIFSELKPETNIYFFFWPEGKQFFFFFLAGAISIIEQQHDKTNNMISVPSKDSDQVCHSDFFTVLSLRVQVTP